MSSFVGETLQKAVDAAKNVFGKPPTILLVLLPDTGEQGPCLSSAALRSGPAALMRHCCGIHTRGDIVDLGVASCRDGCICDERESFV